MTTDHAPPPFPPPTTHTTPPPPQYHNGSWLREHVDTGDTHIISAIMNIDQDVREDWHLTFIDHNGDRHYIALEVSCFANNTTALLPT